MWRLMCIEKLLFNHVGDQNYCHKVLIEFQKYSLVSIIIYIYIILFSFIYSPKCFGSESSSGDIFKLIIHDINVDVVI
jgi:hypothetical protein